MAIAISTSDIPENCDHAAVELMESSGEWFVRVICDDVETIHDFALEPFAVAYAEGQRARLGLAKVDRL